MKTLSQRAVVLLALLSLSVTLVCATAASAAVDLQPLDQAPSAETGQMLDESSRYWFVEFPTAPLADGSQAAAVDADDTAFRQEAAAEHVSYKERMHFKTLWNGFSIEAKSGAISKIRQFASVKAVYPMGVYRIPTTTTVSPDLATALAMTGADIAQNELGLTGKGIKVAIMDTGIDYDHPDLGAGFGPGKRVFTGWDFVGDAYNADPTSPTFNPTPTPDPNPDDCNGHGTHVSGIVGAHGAVTGVAPDVRFGAYRVFGCDGSTTDDIMIAAMERVLHDDMDVLNMSIGDAFNNWPRSPTAAASDRLVRKGVVVVASIGNSGANGLYAAGAPGVGNDVIGVASFDNSHVGLATFTVSPGGESIGYADAAAAPLAPKSGSLPLAKTGTTTTAGDGCVNAPAPGTMTGKAVLIRRGSPPPPAPTCGFYNKALNAQNAGAAAVILYNNVPGRFSPTVAGPIPITIPVVAISDTEGVLLDGRIAAGPATMTWTNATGSFPNPTGGLISSFSSYGLDAELGLKPDIGAPGGLIRSTYPLEKGAYATISGTSMASPHVAGAAALLLQSWNEERGHRGDNSNDVREILQNSADPKPWSLNAPLGFLDHTYRQGAGMLDIDGAILATTRVSPGKLSLGEGTGPVTKTLRIKNKSGATVTYTLSHVVAVGTGPNTFVPGGFNLPATGVSFSSPTVTLGRGDSADVNVTITPDAALLDKSLYNGYIVITPSAGGGDVLRVPYAGFKGDYQSIQILAPTPFNFPSLGRQNADGSFNLVTGGTFTLVGATQQPNVLYHLDHQARNLTIDVVNADGKRLGRAHDLEFLARNSTSTGFFALAWDGSYSKNNHVKQAPDGQYKLVLSVEKPLAEKHNAAHTETWTSPSFTIDRP